MVASRHLELGKVLQASFLADHKDLRNHQISRKPVACDWLVMLKAK